MTTNAALPADMTAIAIDGKGGPEVLKAARQPLPVPGAGEVLIKVAASGVNRPDVLQRKGLYPAPKGHSTLPGLEVAGTIAAVGEDVSRFKDTCFHHLNFVPGARSQNKKGCICRLGNIYFYLS